MNLRTLLAASALLVAAAIPTLATAQRDYGYRPYGNGPRRVYPVRPHYYSYPSYDYFDFGFGYPTGGVTLSIRGGGYYGRPYPRYGHSGGYRSYGYRHR